MIDEEKPVWWIARLSGPVWRVCSCLLKNILRITQFYDIACHTNANLIKLQNLCYDTSFKAAPSNLSSQSDALRTASFNYFSRQNGESFAFPRNTKWKVISSHARPTTRHAFQVLAAISGFSPSVSQCLFLLKTNKNLTSKVQLSECPSSVNSIDARVANAN